MNIDRYIFGFSAHFALIALLTGCASGPPQSRWIGWGTIHFSSLKTGPAEYRLTALGTSRTNEADIRTGFALQAKAICEGKSFSYTVDVGPGKMWVDSRYVRGEFNVLQGVGPVKCGVREEGMNHG